MFRHVEFSLVFFAATLAVAAPVLAAGETAAPCTQTLSDLYARLAPTVVSIAAASVNPVDRAGQVTRVAGSGFVIDPAGLILTNSHVVFGRQAIFATLDDGTTLPAVLLGADPILDLALIRIKPQPDKPPAALPFGNSDRLRVGDEVLAIGNPLGLDQTLTHGIVSSIDRILPNVPYSLNEPLIQTDAAINPGNSGGPLIDRCGRAVGVTTSIMAGAQGIGFAIPINLAAAVVPALLHDGHIIRPWFGVQGQLVTPDLQELLRAPLEKGLLVEGIEADSPAQKAGLRGGRTDLVITGRPVLIGGDVITAINGISLDSPAAFMTTISKLDVGDSMKVTYFRDGARRDLEVKLTERPLMPDDMQPNRGAASAFPATAPSVARIRRLVF